MIAFDVLFWCGVLAVMCAFVLRALVMSDRERRAETAVMLALDSHGPMQEADFGTMVEATAPALGPLLASLEERGLIRSERVSHRVGGSRRYRLTAVGAHELAERAFHGETG